MPGLLTIEVDIRNKRFRDAERGIKFLGERLSKVPDRLPKVFRLEMEKYLKATAEALHRRHGSVWPGGTSSRTLSRRSGDLIKSIRQSVRVRGTRVDDITGEIGGAFYASVHESGATIRPKKAKYLAIPLPEALDRRGVPLKPGPRDWPNTFVAESKKGNLLIFQRRTGRIVPLYVLKREVKIPPRLGMGETLAKGQGFFVDRTIDRMLDAILRA